jgi:hypothetical protein
MKFKSLPLIILLLSAFFAIFSNARAQESDLNKYLVSIQSTNVFSRQRAVLLLAQEREKLIKNLSDVLEGSASLEIKLEAARVLGKYRATEAVDILVKNLTLEDQGHQMLSGMVSEEDYEYLIYPVSMALEKIGNPSIDKLLEISAENDDPKMRTKILKILCRIEGDRDIVRLRLEKALKAEQNPQKQARLQAALKSVDDVKF